MSSSCWLRAGPRNPRDLQGMSRKRGSKEGIFPTPTPQSEETGLRPQSWGTRVLFLLATLKKQQNRKKTKNNNKKQDKDALTNSLSWETGTPQKTWHSSQPSSQLLPGKNPLCFQNIHLPENQLLPFTLVGWLVWGFLFVCFALLLMY